MKVFIRGNIDRLLDEGDVEGVAASPAIDELFKVVLIQTVLFSSFTSITSFNSVSNYNNTFKSKFGQYVAYHS